MAKYSVWFVGTEQESASICYEGRNVFITDKVADAIDYMQVLQDNCSYENPSSLYKICKIEILW